MSGATRLKAVSLGALLLASALLACHQRKTVDPGYHEYAYVTNGKSNSVSVLDLPAASAM